MQIPRVKKVLDSANKKLHQSTREKKVIVRFSYHEYIFVSFCVHDEGGNYSRAR